MATSSQYGAYVPSTNIWDPSNIYSTDLDPELKEILVRMYQNLNLMSNVLNVKDTGIYNNSYESVNSQQWFPNPANNSSTAATAALRPVMRKVINFGRLPNAGAQPIPHGIPINTSYTFTRIYATASDTTGLSYIPIPYASPTLANNIEINIDATNVNIITGSNRSNFNICYVILEYITS